MRSERNEDERREMDDLPTDEELAADDTSDLAITPAGIAALAEADGAMLTPLGITARPEAREGMAARLLFALPRPPVRRPD